MPLPNVGMTFTPLDPLPASSLNDFVENIEALVFKVVDSYIEIYSVSGSEPTDSIDHLTLVSSRH